MGPSLNSAAGGDVLPDVGDVIVNGIHIGYSTSSYC